MRGVRGRRVGPDVVAGHAVGDAVHSDDVDLCACGHRVGDDDVGRKNELVTGLLHEPLHLSDVTGLDQAGSGGPPLREEEREAHRAADQQPVDDLQQVVEHAELVADLRSSNGGDVRPFRLFEQPAED